MFDPVGLLMTFLSMTVIAGGLSGSRIALASAVGLACFAISGANAMLEAVAFGLLQPAQAAGALVINAATSGLLALLAASVARLGAAAPPPADAWRLPPGLWWRLPVIALAYVTAYLGAGMIAYPLLAEFYAGRTIPPMGPLLLLQVLRAGVFVLAAIPILRLAPKSPPLMIGFVFAMLGGAAPLAAENPVFPDAVRLVHLYEVTTSNFLFGLLVGALLGGRGAGLPSRKDGRRSRVAA